MTGKELYKIYAPEGIKWTEWVRPVPFVAIDKYKRMPLTTFIEKKNLIIEYNKNTCIFIDLPGSESVEFGISLARIGYRPIPVYNGTDEPVGSRATTSTYLIEQALINGANILKNIIISKNANPAFLIDSTRTNMYRANSSIFDNSWDLYGQDIPSYEYLEKNGINKIVIIGVKVQRDLKKIFLKFPKDKFEFYITDGYSDLKKVVLKKNLKERLEKEEI